MNRNGRKEAKEINTMRTKCDKGVISPLDPTLDTHGNTAWKNMGLKVAFFSFPVCDSHDVFVSKPAAVQTWMFLLFIVLVKSSDLLLPVQKLLV